MSFENVDQQVVQLYTQLLFLKNQLIMSNMDNLSVSSFMPAMIDFINVIGEEINRQAQ